MNEQGRTDPQDRKSPDDLGLFRAIFEQAAVGVAQIETTTGRFLRVNQRYADIVGCSRLELERLHFQTLTHPDDLVADLDIMRQLVAGEIRAFTREKRYVHKDGNIVWVNLTVSPLWAPGEPPTSHIVVVEDTTERKQDQEALRRSEEMFRRTFDLSPVGAVVVGLDQRFLRCNEAFCRFLGYAETELIGHPFQEVTFPEDKETGQAELRSLVAGSMDRAQLRKRYVRKDGRVVWGELSISLVRDAQGQPLFFLPIVQDITERKQAEEALRESELRYRTLFEFSPAGFLLEDDRGEILDYNDALCGAFGYSRDELRGQNVRLLVPPQHQHLVDRHLAEIKAGKTLTHEVDNIGKDGLPRQMELRERPFPLADGRTGVLVIANDITERKRAELALAENQMRLQSIVSNAPIILFGLDSLGVFRVSEGKGLQALGLKPGEVVGRSALELYREYPSIVAALKKALAGEAQSVTHDMGRWVFDVHYSPLKNEQGQVTGLIGVATDITERKQAEEARRASEARFRAVFTQATVGLAHADEQGRLLEVNAAFAALLGRTVEDLQGKTARDFTHPEDFPREQAVIRSMLQRGESSCRLEKRYLRPDGRAVWTDLSVFTVRPTETSPALLMGMTIDITERKRMEEELRIKESAMDSAIAGIALSDLDGKINYANAAWLRMHGYESAAEVMGTTPLDHAANQADARAIIEAIKAQGRWTGEFMYRRRDGSCLLAEMIANVVTDAAGRPVCLLASFQDITERKRAEEALRESEERFRSLVETTSDWVWETNAQGAYTYVSPKVRDLLGYDPEEVLGRTPFELKPSSEAARVGEIMRGIIARRAPLPSLENTNRHKDGRLVILETSGVPVLDSDGNFLGYRGIDRDITARRQAEEERQAVERRYRLLFDSANDGIFILDETGFIDCNEHGAQMYGLPKERLLGLSPAALSPERQPDGRVSAEEIASTIGRVLSGEPQQLQWQSRRADGTLFDVEITLGKIEWQGKTYLQCIARDITERKKAEEALRRSQADLEEAQAVGHVGSWTSDRSRSGSVAWSKETLRIFGLAEGEFDGRLETFWSLIHPDDVPAVKAASTAALASGKQYALDHRIIRRDGAVRWVHEQAQVERDAAGKPVRMVGVVQDITERKQAEEILRASLEEKTALLKEVHHRVKNNLQIVSSLLNLQAGQDKNSVVTEALRRMQSRVRSMAMLHEMLYRAESLARLDFAAYVRRLCDYLFRALGSEGGRVQTKFDLAPVELGLEQAVPCGLIINELVSNALKHAFPAPRPGRITVRLAADAEAHICVTVADDGVGLPAGLDPAQAPTLGLHLVQILTTQLKGTLAVERDRGAAFHVRFPAH